MLNYHRTAIPAGSSPRAQEEAELMPSCVCSVPELEDEDEVFGGEFTVASSAVKNVVKLSFSSKR